MLASIVETRRFALKSRREEKRGVFLIEFCDYGVGVTEGMNEVIFRPGFRAPNAGRSHATGQGIGLAVVRSIVIAHGGEVRLVRNRRPTRFEIRLPETLAATAVSA